MLRVDGASVPGVRRCGAWCLSVWCVGGLQQLNNTFSPFLPRSVLPQLLLLQSLLSSPSLLLLLQIGLSALLWRKDEAAHLIISQLHVVQKHQESWPSLSLGLFFPMYRACSTVHSSSECALCVFRTEKHRLSLPLFSVVPSYCSSLSSRLSSAFHSQHSLSVCWTETLSSGDRQSHSSQAGSSQFFSLFFY